MAKNPTLTVEENVIPAQIIGPAFQVQTAYLLCAKGDRARLQLAMTKYKTVTKATLIVEGAAMLAWRKKNASSSRIVWIVFVKTGFALPRKIHVKMAYNMNLN